MDLHKRFWELNVVPLLLSGLVRPAKIINVRQPAVIGTRKSQLRPQAPRSLVSMTNSLKV